MHNKKRKPSKKHPWAVWNPGALAKSPKLREKSYAMTKSWMEKMKK